MKGATVRRENFDSLVDKADEVEKLEWSADVDSSLGMVVKANDEFLIWGPASVEVVDKEGDKINAQALEKALPQLLKRARLSYAHTDQIVGRILEGFETKAEASVEIDGVEYERKNFPTDVLKVDDQPSALFVAGEVFDDSNQAEEVREKIEEGEIDSYSISGEALVTQKQVDGDQVYDDILELDLSAVTLCEEGMNQGAKFARVSDQAEVENVEYASGSVDTDTSTDSTDATQTAKSMSKSEEEPNGESNEEFVKRSELPDSFVSKDDVEDIAEKLFKSHLPSSPLATKNHVEGRIENVEGTEERVSALEDRVQKLRSKLEQKGGDYEDDEEDEMEEEEKQEDEMEEDEMEDYEEEDEMEDHDGGHDDKSFSPEELKAELPEDVWKVVSEYVPTDADDKSVTKDEDEEEDLQKEVEEILSGEAVNETGVPTDDPEEDIEKWVTEKDDEDSSTARSPALSMWED
jgi:hypothetical protein